MKNLALIPTARQSLTGVSEPTQRIGNTRRPQAIGERMTGKADFTDEEWEQILQGPPTAGLIVITAQRGGSFRESFSMAKAYSEARRQHGDSELLDTIASTKPEVDHTRYHSPEELKEHGLGHLRDAVALLEQKATPEEVDDYKRFVINLAQRVAEAHKEGFLGLSGERVSDAEREAIEEIAGALGTGSEQPAKD
jgi:hypothetical protein